jgi:aryl-alcohol dehydrogenase-like predicted oxidoreductase
MEGKMKYRKFGSTDIDISTIVMGCWAIGGGYTWGEQDERDSIDTIRAAIDAGINMFDTAEFYNDGISEEVLGKGLSGRRNEVLIATKAWPDNLTADKLIRACERSMKRLRTDYIDLYQIHWPNWNVPLEESLGAMEKLKQDGKIRFIGVSNFGVRDLTEAVGCAEIVTDQLVYSLLFRAIEYEILEKCRKAQLGVLAYSPLAQGLLTGKFKEPDEVDDERARVRWFSKNRSGTVHDSEGCEKEAFEAVEKIQAICDDIGEPMANVALAWVLQQPGVTAVLAGARKPDQIINNALAVDLELTREVLNSLSDATEEVKKKIGPNADPWRTASRIR